MNFHCDNITMVFWVLFSLSGCYVCVSVIAIPTKWCAQGIHNPRGQLPMGLVACLVHCLWNLVSQTKRHFAFPYLYILSSSIFSDGAATIRIPAWYSQHWNYREVSMNYPKSLIQLFINNVNIFSGFHFRPPMYWEYIVYTLNALVVWSEICGYLLKMMTSFMNSA